MKLVAAVLLCLTAAVTVSAQKKVADPPAAERPFAESREAIVVTTDDWDTVAGTAQMFQRKNRASEWKAVGKPFPVVVGRSGLAWDPAEPGGKSEPIKREGDGKSPAGLFPLTSMFGRATKPEGIALPYTKLGPYTECVDDGNSTFYNRIVDRMRVGNFDWRSSEKMLAVGDAYALGVFVAYNSFPPVKGNGSCIFLHIWKDAASGTAGCTAMERRNLELIAAWLSPAKNPYLVQMTREAYERNRKKWNLPKIN